MIKLIPIQNLQSQKIDYNCLREDFYFQQWHQKKEPLSKLDLSLPKDMSAQRRKEGIALAEKI